MFHQPFKYLPWYESTILKPIYDNGFRFESDQHISEFRAPLLIMHAEDDRVIPLQLGYKLYRTALETRGKSWGPVEFHRFDGKFGHKYIVRAKNFASIVDEFIKRYRDETYWRQKSTHRLDDINHFAINENYEISNGTPKILGSFRVIWTFAIKSCRCSCFPCPQLFHRQRVFSHISFFYFR